MENMLSFSPGQVVLIGAVYFWLLVGFPVLILRKLNQIVGLLEVQVYGDEEGEEEEDALDHGE